MIDYDKILEQAEQLAKEATKSSDLSNAIYAQEVGLFAKYFQTEDQRREFVYSSQYRKINQLLSDMRDRELNLTEQD